MQPTFSTLALSAQALINKATRRSRLRRAAQSYWGETDTHPSWGDAVLAVFIAVAVVGFFA